MKKVIVALVLCTLMSLNTANAKTTFLPKVGNSIGTRNTTSASANNAARCVSTGYTFTSMSGCGELLDVCPQAPTHFRYCCPQGYRYTLEQCQAMGKVSVGTDAPNCDYYKCE